MSKTEFLKIQTDQFLDILKGTSFFKHIPKKYLDKLSELVEIKIFEASDTILVEGQRNTSLYFLVRGRLGVSVSGDKIATLDRPGDIVGEISLINSTVTSATVVAEITSTVVLMNIDHIKKDAPDLMKVIEESGYKLFAAILAERLVITNDKARKFEKANRELIEAKSELEQRVSERTAELKQKNENLELAVSENRQLVRVLCHDLNNTLTVIQYTSTVATSPAPKTPEKELAYWKKIQLATEKVKDLMAYVRDSLALESGKTKFALTPVNLLEILDSSEFIFQQQFEGKKIKFEIQVSPDVFVMAEPISLANSVINNLISNAIKFSPLGKKIIVKVVKVEDSIITVSVRDQGIGMPKDLLADIFSMTKKSSRIGTAGEKGTGFGMPLVRAHMDAYGGSIEIQSWEQGDPSGESGTECLLKFRVGMNPN